MSKRATCGPYLRWRIRSGKVQIRIAAKASPPERSAARELSQALRAMTGLSIPINTQPQAPAHTMTIGDAALPEGERHGLAPLAEDHVEIHALDKHNLLLRGGGPRGALYAVYEWLDWLGCRWFHPTQTQIPVRATLTAPKELHARPGFEYREAHWHSAYQDPIWACRNRLNGSHGTIPEALGGGRLGLTAACPTSIAWLRRVVLSTTTVARGARPTLTTFGLLRTYLQLEPRQLR